MGLISRLYNFVTGTAIVAAQVNAELDQVLGVINGNIDVDNVDTLPISKVTNLSAEHNTDGTHGTVTSDGGITITQVAGGSVALASKVTGDTNNRCQILQNGDITHGPGNAVKDLAQGRTGIKEYTFSAADGTNSTKTIFKTNEANFNKTSDGLTHLTTTHKRSYWVAAACSIHPYDDQLDFSGDYYVCPELTGIFYYYGIISINEVPDGATLTKLTIIGVTGASYGTIVAQLVSNDHSTTRSLIASVTATGGATSDSDTCSTVVDHGSYGYTVILSANVASGGAVTDAKIYKIEIEYTTVNLSQT